MVLRIELKVPRAELASSFNGATEYALERLCLVIERDLRMNQVQARVLFSCFERGTEHEYCLDVDVLGDDDPSKMWDIIRPSLTTATNRVSGIFQNRTIKVWICEVKSGDIAEYSCPLG